MCFSPEASFASGAIVSSIGVAAVRKVKKPSQILFAGIPLFFGAQQISEGVVWLSLLDPGYARLQKIGMYAFLFMARVAWPAMMALAILLMETDEKKKKILRMLLVMGSSVSLYYTYCLLFLNVAPNISGHHVQYISDFSESLAVPVFIIYVIAGITPLFVSSIKKTIPLGILLFLSCFVTAIFYMQYLTSVWCFFAAIVSMVIFWIVNDSTLIEYHKPISA